MNVEKIREDFPILKQNIKGKPVVYFDSACVSLKPKQVIDAMQPYYTEYTACHGRSIHKFGARTTQEFAKAHDTIAKFIGANRGEVVFTRNTTEGINIVANALDFSDRKKVITTNLEHNSNLIPWMKKAKEGKIKHEMTIVKEHGIFDMEDFGKKLDDDTKLVSIVYTSNVTGTTMPVEEIIKIAHDNGSLVMLDAAQAVPHKEIDVKKLDVDFLAFSGHKMLGPSGMGALYAKYELLDEMDQFIVGGETVQNVTKQGYLIEEPPAKFEAGLQNYAGAIGFAAATEYLRKIGMNNIEKYEHSLAEKIIPALAEISGVQMTSPTDENQFSAIATFNIKSMSPHDIALMLDEMGNIAIRSGMHCAHYYHNEYLNAKSGTARASLYIYNTMEEIDFFIEKLTEIARMVG